MCWLSLSAQVGPFNIERVGRSNPQSEGQRDIRGSATVELSMLVTMICFPLRLLLPQVRLK
jgi:hypothetical protein